MVEFSKKIKFTGICQNDCIQIGDKQIDYDINIRVRQIVEGLVDDRINGRIRQIGDARIDYDINGQIREVGDNLLLLYKTIQSFNNKNAH